MTILNNDIKNYIESLYTKFKGELGLLQEYGYKNNFPIIRRDTARFIVTLLSLKKVKSILEIGSCIGFSTCLMAKFLEEDANITTIERFDTMIKKSKENFKKLKLENKIKLLEGDAIDVLKGLKGPYDLIFIDAAKGQYINYLDSCIDLLEVGGLIIADDVLQDGEVMKKICEIPKRNRTIHKRMNEFLKIICNTEGIESCVLPIGNGLSVSVKTKEKVDLRSF